MRTMLPSLLYLDRYRNGGTRTYSQHADYTEALERYRPGSISPTFDITAFQIHSDHLNIYLADPDPSILGVYAGEALSLFCVHPQILECVSDDPYLKRIGSLGARELKIPVSPSSSTRTLYVHGEGPPHALKVHFPFRISRYERRMRDEVVEQAILVSRELQGGIGAMSPDFAFLREVIGVTYKNLEPQAPRGENWGYLVREMAPFPLSMEGDRPLVPGFSLYGRDFFRPREAPLLFDLMKIRDPRDYVLEEIMFPIIRHWAECFLNFGLLLEPHGQNVLLEIGSEGEISRIIYRDLNLGVDNRRRRDLGIPLNTSNNYNHQETGEFASITYDMFMGGHFFDFLVACIVDRHPALVPEDFRGPCRGEFARVLPEYGRYFPETVQYFSEKRDRFGKPLFAATGRAPDWRP